MPSVGAMVQHGLYRLDLGWGRTYRRLRERVGLQRPARIAAYRGYATATHGRIMARLLEDRGVAGHEEGASVPAALLASWRRYATLEIPEAPVALRWRDRRCATVTDEEGHLDVEIERPADAAPGWSQAWIELDGTEVRAPAEIFVPPAEADVAIVSDIDDTVIDTNVRHPLERAAALFLTDTRTRLPFPGVSGLYRSLHRGVNPMVYLSSSPWNLYEHLVELFERHEVPRGPLLLREWGIGREEIAPLGSHAHKREHLERLLSDLSLPFVLIGDSGQHDARHYASAAIAHPGRVAAIIIRDVGTRRREELDGLAGRVRRTGTPFHVVCDSDEAASVLASEGLVRDVDVADVRADRDRDEHAPEPLREALDRD